MMKTISKIAAIVMSLTMIVSLAACGAEKNNEASSVESAEVKTVTTEVRFGALYGPTGVSLAKLAKEKATIAEAYSDGANRTPTRRTMWTSRPRWWASSPPATWT